MKNQSPNMLKMGLAVFLIFFFLCCPKTIAITRDSSSQKIAVIAVDPDLGDIKFYLNSPRILGEINWYKSHGYRLASVPGTVDGITRALMDSRVRAITFVGEGGARTSSGKPTSSLAGLKAETWRSVVRMALINQYIKSGLPQDDAIDRANNESLNFNLERVVNYSCFSLADTDIAELFVEPGGVYYGSSVLYSGNPLSFVYFWFTDKMQFSLEAYNVPSVAHSQTQVSGANLEGSWRGCDGRVVTFSKEGDQYVGRYTSLGGLGKYGFSVNEVGYYARRTPNGTYVGQVKWRWTDGRYQWKPNTIIIESNTYRDSGSDNCSRHMERVGY